MAVIKPCPSCRQPLALPQPTPAQIRCPKCGAVINLKAALAPTPQVASGPPPLPLQSMPAPSPHVTSTPPLPPPMPTLPRPSAAPATPASSAQGMLWIVGGLSAFLLLGCIASIGIGFAYWQYGGDKKKSTPEPGNSTVAKEEPKSEPVLLIVPKPKAPEPPPLSPKVRASIDKGVAHLKQRFLDGSQMSKLNDPLGHAHGVQTGGAALVGLTLIEAGVPPNDPVVQQILERVRKNASTVTHVYSVGTVLFFLNRLAQADALNDNDKKLQRRMALQIVGGQCHDGRWTYFNPPLSEEQEKNLLRDLEAKTYRPTRPFPTMTPVYTSSNSMTQFALLALWGSRKYVPVRQPILHAAARFHSTQLPGGGWNYARNDMPDYFYDSNCCAGLLALAMEKTLREDKEFQGQAGTTDPPANPRADEQCDKAFAHLAKIIGRNKNDPVRNDKFIGNIIRADAYGDYYFLWCLERVSVIYDKEKIGGKDWYGWGSEAIVQNQRDNGSWDDMHGDVSDTCFAMLFLLRANLAKDLTESIRSRLNN